MNVRHIVRSLLLAATLIAAACACAQTTPTIAIDPAGENGVVHLGPLDAASEAKFAKTFQIPLYGQYKPYALVLQNNSGRAIIALTVVWTYTSEERVTRAFGVRIDSLSAGGSGFSSGSQIRTSLPTAGGQGRPQEAPIRFSTGRVSADPPYVAAANEAVLVAPGFFVSESAARRGSGSPPGSVEPGDLPSAAIMSVSLDTVILDDGTVLGPDQSHSVDDITASRAALDVVVNAVRTAEQSGQDPAAVLAQFANMRQTTAKHGPAIALQSNVARRLMHSPDWRKQIEKMETVQLPNFHR
jgi:hypothetical protein